MKRDERWTLFACAAVTSAALNHGTTTDAAAITADQMMEHFDKRFPPAPMPAKPEPTSTPTKGRPYTDGK